MLFYPYGIVLQAMALIHFYQRRPDTYWLFIILMGGSIGSLAYILMEVVPDMGLLRGSFQAFPRRKRIKQLEGLIVDNPSIGNYEELGDLLLDEDQFVRARECFDKVIAKSDSIDPFYRRALCAIALNDFPAAAADLERVTTRDPKYDYHRAMGFRAHALAKIGDRDTADKLFTAALELSTLSEIQFNCASFLAETGRTAEARELLEKILLKKKTMPDYIRRRERPWFRKANGLLKTLPR
jgi:hypothetical protein